MSLLENNLIYPKEQSDGEQRLMMLETIREYELVCLEDSGGAEVVRHAHASYYVAIAEEVEPKLISAEQENWLQRLEQEHMYNPCRQIEHLFSLFVIRFELSLLCLSFFV